MVTPDVEGAAGEAAQQFAFEVLIIIMRLGPERTTRFTDGGRVGRVILDVATFYTLKK